MSQQSMSSVPQATESDPQNAADTPAFRRKPNAAALGIILLVLLAIGIGFYFHSRNFEDTDDAQIDGHLNPVTSRVDGTIKTVSADDNQSVHAGQLLVELDPTDSQIALDQAKAQLDQSQAQTEAADPNLPITITSNRTDAATERAEIANAEASLAQAQSDLVSATAKVNEAEANNTQRQADFARYKTLFERSEVSHASYDQYKAAAVAQREVVAAAHASLLSAQKVTEQRQAQVLQQKERLQQSLHNAPLQVAIREADIRSQRANKEAAQAALEKAQHALSYCNIVAPVSGVVTQRSAEVGARIAAGEQLMMIVQTSDLWVTANFKETQLARVHPGQHAHIFVDALNESFDGVVESMPAVTGARTSVLPPENATGNYVKVIQRLPVRIRLTPGQKDLEKLRPGMSVEPKIRLE